jgi:hypothetical protein
MTFEGTFLVDTNTYVRVARSATCVLGDHAGLELRLLPEIANECSRSSRLKTISPWILQPPHPEMRDLWTLRLSKAEKRNVGDRKAELIDAVADTLEDFAQRKRARGDDRSVLSQPDKAVFYTAYALGCGVVTDEGPLTLLCKEFEVPHYTTLQLLQHLEQQTVLNRPQIETMVRYWQYEKDLPKNWKKDYLVLFGSPLPELGLDGGA